MQPQFRDGPKPVSNAEGSTKTEKLRKLSPMKTTKVRAGRRPRLYRITAASQKPTLVAELYDFRNTVTKTVSAEMPLDLFLMVNTSKVAYLYREGQDLAIVYPSGPGGYEDTANFTYDNVLREMSLPPHERGVTSPVSPTTPKDLLADVKVGDVLRHQACDYHVGRAWKDMMVPNNRATVVGVSRCFVRVKMYNGNVSSHRRKDGLAYVGSIYRVAPLNA